MAKTLEEQLQANPGMAGQVDPTTHARRPTLQEVKDMRETATRQREIANHGAETLKIVEGEAHASSEAYSDLVLANIPKRRELEMKRDTLGIKRQSAAVSLDAELREIADKEREAQKKADEAAAEERKKNAPKPTVGSLWRDAKGRFVNAQYYNGTMYEGDAAGDTRQKSLEALAEAGRKMVEGKSGDDATVIRELLDVFKQLGTVWTDKDKVLEDLKEAVSMMRGQIKNMR